MGGFVFKFGLKWRYKDRQGDFTLVNRGFLKGIRNWRPAFEMVADDVLQPYVQRAFQTEGASQIAQGWKQLAPSTVKRRGSAHPILQVTGALRESFEKSGAEHVQEVSATRLVWGSSDPKSIFHEFGTRGRVNFKAAGARAVIHNTKKSRERLERASGENAGIPPRPMLVWSRRLANEITSKFTAYGALIARQAGYAITRGEAVSPVEARQIGMKRITS